MLQVALILFYLSFSSAALMDDSDWRLWEQFNNEYMKSYESDAEGAKRFAIFRQNLDFIRSGNRDSKFKMGITEFADMTNQEFRSKMLTSPEMPATSILNNIRDHESPDAIDWRDNDTVTPVRTMQLGFESAVIAVVEGLEGQYAQKHGNLTRLSTQQVVDCAAEDDTRTIEGVYHYYCSIAKGIASEADYPAQDRGECKFDMSKSVEQQVGWGSIRSGEETTLKNYVAFAGPFVATIDAGEAGFQLYTSGVFSSDTCGKDAPNHAVLIAGYGVDSGQEYWLVKNNWGTGWGEVGYIRIARNKGNMCAIASHASYPILQPFPVSFANIKQGE